MTADRQDGRKTAHLIEWALFLAVVGGFIRMAWMTIDKGYFPQPFFWDSDDTWRDWFSTSVWAHETGAYDSWLTVYPPLSFVILKLFSNPACYDLAWDKEARICDWVGVGAIHLIFIFNIFLTAWVFMKVDRKTALQRSVALSAGMPMLFGLERGNLIMLCYTFVLLGFGPLVKSARLRWLCVGLAVNLKIYLISGIFVQLLRRKWLGFEGMILSVIFVYLVSYFLFGDGTPIQIFNNLVNFAGGTSFTPNQILEIWYPNTYNALYYVLADSPAPLSMFVDSRVIDTAVFVVPLAVRSGQVIIILAAIATWLRPEAVPPYRVTFLGIALAMITTETSAYTQPLLIFFVFLESWKGWARPAAITACYILCIPGEILLSSATPTIQYSFIGGRYVVFEQGLALGMFLRPFLLLFCTYMLGLYTIWEVFRDVRRQGWKDRWRFRNDWPLLPRIVRPRPPAVTADPG